MNLCELCKEAHVRQKNTSHHIIEAIVELDEVLGDTKTTQTKLSLKCFVHPSQELKLYCTTCDQVNIHLRRPLCLANEFQIQFFVFSAQVACHNCTILLHKAHKFESISRASKNNLKLVKESLERNRKFFNYVNDSISKLSASVKKINNQADIVQVIGFLTDVNA